MNSKTKGTKSESMSPFRPHIMLRPSSERQRRLNVLEDRMKAVSLAWRRAHARWKALRLAADMADDATRRALYARARRVRVEALRLHWTRVQLRDAHETLSLSLIIEPPAVEASTPGIRVGRRRRA